MKKIISFILYFKEEKEYCYGTYLQINFYFGDVPLGDAGIVL
jgi:hypothetical protein